MPEKGETRPEGVRTLDHTADVGLEIDGLDLPELFERAAIGAMWLVLDRLPGPSMGERPIQPEPEARPVEIVEEELSTLFRSWLRKILFWEETEGFVTLGARLSLLPTPVCSSQDGLAFRLHGTVLGCLEEGLRVREIKGVTFHGLEVENVGEGWRGRVIFDV